VPAQKGIARNDNRARERAIIMQQVPLYVITIRSMRPCMQRAVLPLSCK